jgi:polar amino acid transport system substrate-binding protein
MGGMVADLVLAMNEVQDDYVFEIVPTSATDRYDDLESRKIDMLAFENIAWGWQDMAVDASEVYMGGSEVYVAAAGADGGQAFFNDIATHKIAAVYGYHYGFAGFNGDPAYLQTSFAVEQPLNPCTSLYYVLDGRVDLAVVPELYLQMFLREYPQYQGRFMVGDTPDQTYEHSFVVSRDRGPTVEEINGIIAKLRTSGAFDRMMEPYLF